MLVLQWYPACDAHGEPMAAAPTGCLRTPLKRSSRLRILKRLVAGQRLLDGLAGVRVPGFAGSEFENDGCVFGVCCARVAL